MKPAQRAITRTVSDATTVTLAVAFLLAAIGGALIATERELARQAVINQEQR